MIVRRIAFHRHRARRLVLAGSWHRRVWIGIVCLQLESELVGILPIAPLQLLLHANRMRQHGLLQRVGDDHRGFLRCRGFRHRHRIAVSKISIADLVLVGSLPQVAVRFDFRHRVRLLGACRNNHVGGPFAAIVTLQRDRLIGIVALFDIHRDAFRLVTVSTPLLFDMQRRGNHLDHRMRIRIAAACMIHAIGRVRQARGIVRMETRLVRGRGVSRQIGVRVTLYAVISILTGVQVGGILVIRFLRGFHVVFQRVCHVVDQRLQECDREFLRARVIRQGVIDILSQGDHLAGSILGNDLVVAIRKLDIAGERVLHGHLGVCGCGGLALLNLVEDGIQLRSVRRAFIIAGFDIPFTALVVFRCLWEIAGHRMHELVLVAGERGRVGTGEDADGIHRGATIFQFLGSFDGLICHFTLEATRRCRRTIREKDNDLLRIGSSTAHHLGRKIESIVGSGGASGFEFADFVLQTVHIRSQIANDLGVVVGVPTTSVRVIPDFVLFVAGELHQSNANQFGTGLRISIRSFIKKCFNRFFQCV